MPLALKVEVDERSLDEAGSRIESILDSVGGRAASQFMAGFSGGISSGLSSSLSSVRSSFSDIEGSAASMGSKVSSGAALAGVGIAGIGVAAVAVGKQLYDLGAVWDTISDNITIRTGRMGADLAKLTDAVGDIGRVTAASLSSIGDVVGQLSQSMPDLAANNDALKQMGSNLAFLGEHGQAVNIRQLGMALTAFGVNAADAVGALDSLNTVSQKTGIPINSLIESVRSGAPQFKQFGLDISQATGLLAAFSEAGIEPGLAVSGLRIGLKNLGDDARGAGPALADVITKIKAFHDANDEISARKLAEDTFGARNFAPFLDAIETGTVNVKALTAAVNETGDSIRDLQKATDDGAQGFTKLKNTAETMLKPIGDFLFSNINQPLLLITDQIDSLEHQATAPITPDSPLGRMLLPAGGLPGSPGQPSPNGVGGAATDGRLLPYSWGTTPINPPAAPSAGQTPALGQAEVPYGPGYGAPPRPGETTSVYNAEQGILEAQHKTAESRAQLVRVEADSKTTADQLIKARNDLAKAEGDEIQAQMRLSDAYAEASKKAEKAGTTLDEFGNKLDADLGLSEGLPGLAENLFRFLGNLAAAPLLGPLQAISAAQGGIGQTGSGAFGMLAQQGAFGPQYTPEGMAAAAAASGGGGGGGPGGLAALLGGPIAGGSGPGLLPSAGPVGSPGPGLLPSAGPVGSPKPGESARDFAHRVMMPFWESQGITAGDHGADQYGEHQNGALDLMVSDLAEGNKVLQEVLSDPNVYGAIFNNQTYGYGHGSTPQDYSAGHTGDPSQDHTNHVHAWYKPGGAGNITSGPPVPPTGPGAPPSAAPAGPGAPGSPVTAGQPGSYPPGTNPLDMLIPGAAAGGGIPIIAHAGEHMLTANDVSAMGGQVGVYNFRNALHMAGGGPPESPQLPPPPPPPPVQHMPTSSGRGSGPAPGPQPMAGTGLGSTTLGPGSSVASGQGGGPAPGPSPIGGKEISAPSGAAPGGGLAQTLTGAASMAADAFAPGSGAAVQMASQVIQRSIKFGGQLAGIGVGGLMQTFLPTGASDLANNNWATRIAGGFAGVSPQIPNLAGKSASVDAMQQKALSPSALPPPISSGQGSGAPPGPNQNLTINNYGATPDQTAAAATHHLNIMNNGIQGSR